MLLSKIFCAFLVASKIEGGDSIANMRLNLTNDAVHSVNKLQRFRMRSIGIVFFYEPSIYLPRKERSANNYFLISDDSEIIQPLYFKILFNFYSFHYQCGRLNANIKVMLRSRLITIILISRSV